MSPVIIITFFANISCHARTLKVAQSPRLCLCKRFICSLATPHQLLPSTSSILAAPPSLPPFFCLRVWGQKNVIVLLEVCPPRKQSAAKLSRWAAGFFFQKRLTPCIHSFLFCFIYLYSAVQDRCVNFFHVLLLFKLKTFIIMQNSLQTVKPKN